MSEYDNKYQCQKCGGPNEIGRHHTEDGHISECYTTCKDCGHEAFWAYGHFETEN